MGWKKGMFLPVARQVHEVPAIINYKMVYALCFPCKESTWLSLIMRKLFYWWKKKGVINQKEFQIIQKEFQTWFW